MPSCGKCDHDQVLLSSVSVYAIRSDLASQKWYASRIRHGYGLHPRPNECHGCGRREGLIAYEFGLAKVLSAKRDWTMKAASVVVSVVSVPLTAPA